MSRIKVYTKESYKSKQLIIYLNESIAIDKEFILDNEPITLHHDVSGFSLNGDLSLKVLLRISDGSTLNIDGAKWDFTRIKQGRWKATCESCKKPKYILTERQYWLAIDEGSAVKGILHNVQKNPKPYEAIKISGNE